jgi:hypothetical protein
LKLLSFCTRLLVLPPPACRAVCAVVRCACVFARSCAGARARSVRCVCGGACVRVRACVVSCVLLAAAVPAVLLCPLSCRCCCWCSALPCCLLALLAVCLGRGCLWSSRCCFLLCVCCRRRRPSVGCWCWLLCCVVLSVGPRLVVRCCFRSWFGAVVPSLASPLGRVIDLEQLE